MLQFYRSESDGLVRPNYSFGSGEDVFVIPGLQDRKFTHDEVRLAFDLLDIDKNGTLDVSDIHHMLAITGQIDLSNKL